MKKIINLFKVFWFLNLEAKIGILFLIPPIWGVFAFIFQVNLNSFPDSWNCITSFLQDGAYAATPSIPLYLGLMAIAGAYLIKGNLKNKD